MDIQRNSEDILALESHPKSSLNYKPSLATPFPLPFVQVLALVHQSLALQPCFHEVLGHHLSSHQVLYPICHQQPHLTIKRPLHHPSLIALQYFSKIVDFLISSNSI